MERNMKMKMIVVVGIVMIVGMAVGEAAISCGTVASALGPCLEYLKSGGVPSASCCAGVKSLKSQAATPADRRTVCGCLKQAASGVNPAFASSLPSKCGVGVPYKISPSTDCSKIN